MDTSFLFQNCYTGTDFENLMVRFLGEHGFRAKKTGSNDGGIDIVATSIMGDTIGKVIFQKASHLLAPSISEASNSDGEMV